MRNTLLCLFITCIGNVSSAQEADSWLAAIQRNTIAPVANDYYAAAPAGPALYFVKAGNISVPYLVYVPRSYDPAREMPAVLFLHGAILARDSFQYKSPEVAGEPVFAVADQLNTTVIFPFGRSGFMWPAQEDANENLLRILADTERHYHIDKRRVLAGGISMGGMGTYWLMTHRADAFAGFYAFSAAPHPAVWDKAADKAGRERPLLLTIARDDVGVSYDEAYAAHEQYKKQWPLWTLEAAPSGGHRFIYGPDGARYVRSVINRLLLGTQR